MSLRSTSAPILRALRSGASVWLRSTSAPILTSAPIGASVWLRSTSAPILRALRQEIRRPAWYCWR